MQRLCFKHKGDSNEASMIFRSGTFVLFLQLVYEPATNVARARKRGNICVGNNLSTTMCPRLPGPLYGRVYLGLFRTGTVKHYPYINAGKFVARSSLSITYKKMAVTRNSLLPQWKPVD